LAGGGAGRLEYYSHYRQRRALRQIAVSVGRLTQCDPAATRGGMTQCFAVIFSPGGISGRGPAYLPEQNRTVVRAEGLEPSRALRPNGFSYRPRLSPPQHPVDRLRQVCGLDYPFATPRNLRGSGAARLVSTPSRPEMCSPAGLGSGSPFSGFPEFEQFCTAGFPPGTQVQLKSVASADFATPAWPPQV
jgi:hypothetical protein